LGKTNTKEAIKFVDLLLSLGADTGLVSRGYTPLGEYFIEE
jgi:hypothetical protein